MARLSLAPDFSVKDGRMQICQAEPGKRRMRTIFHCNKLPNLVNYCYEIWCLKVFFPFLSIKSEIDLLVCGNLSPIHLKTGDTHEENTICKPLFALPFCISL